MRRLINVYASNFTARCRVDVFKSEQPPFALILPRTGALDVHPQRMDHFIEEAFASALGGLAIPRILFDVRDHAGVENALAIVRGIKAPIEVEIGASAVQPHLFVHVLQRFQALWVSAVA